MATILRLVQETELRLKIYDPDCNFLRADDAEPAHAPHIIAWQQPIRRDSTDPATRAAELEELRRKLLNLIVANEARRRFAT